jgi:Trypsin-co-occurring domain 2
MDRIPLSAMLAELRDQLLETQAVGQDSPLRFQMEDIEIELQFTTTQETKGGGGIKFWLVNADAEGKTSDAKTQKLKLKLKPVGPDGQATEIADEDTRRRPKR